MKFKNKLDDYAESGIYFYKIDYVAEMFPVPLPDFDESGEDINTFDDILLTSFQFGFDEIFIPRDEEITGFVGEEEIIISRRDFLAWQIIRASAETIYQLINKTEAYLLEILDDDEEREKNKDYHPESWLSSCDSSDDEYAKGLEYINRLRNDRPEELVERLVESILDENSGILSWLETEIEIHENLDNIREIYAEWPVPLMIVSRGYFDVYIEQGTDTGLMREGWRVFQVMVRNYDEGGDFGNCETTTWPT